MRRVGDRCGAVRVRRTRWGVGIGVGGVLAVAACASLIKAPEVNVETVRVESVTLSGGTLTLNLRLTNPNNFELRGTAVDYTLRVAETGASDPRWTELAGGVREEGFVLPPLGAAEVAVPVRFDWAGVGTALREIFRRGRLDYQTEGAVRVELPGGARRVPFRRQGQVSM